MIYIFVYLSVGLLFSSWFLLSYTIVLGDNYISFSIRCRLKMRLSSRLLFSYYVWAHPCIDVFLVMFATYLVKVFFQHSQPITQFILSYLTLLFIVIPPQKFSSIISQIQCFLYYSWRLICVNTFNYFL